MKDAKGWILLTTALALVGTGVSFLDLGAEGPRPVPMAIEAVAEEPLARTASSEHLPPAPAPGYGEPASARQHTDPEAAKASIEPELRIAASVLAQDLFDAEAVARLASLMPDQIEWRTRDDRAALHQVLHGQCELGLVSGLPGQKPESSGLEFAPLGDFVLVFLRSKGQEIRQLQTAQIHRILSGHYVDWRRVGGEEGAITLPDQKIELTSDSRQLVPSSKPAPLCDATDVQFVEGQTGGFAVLDLALLRDAQGQLFVDPMVVTVDGVAPSPEAFGKGHYGPGRRFWLVWREDAGARTRSLVQTLSAPSMLRQMAPRLLLPSRESRR